MAILVPILGHDGRGTTQFKAVDEHGRELAVGKLEIDLIPGATRHGTISFVTTDAEGDSRPESVGGIGQALRGDA